MYNLKNMFKKSFKVIAASTILLLGIEISIGLNLGFYYHPVANTELTAANTVVKIKEGRSNARSQTIFFLHQSKSGGTSVCNIISQHSDVPMTDVDGNVTGAHSPSRESCNVLFQKADGSWDPGWGAPRYCADLIPYTMDAEMRAFQRKNWVVVEATYYDEFPCPGYRSFTIMRHPVKRYLSLINYIGMNKTMVLEILGGKNRPVDGHAFFVNNYHNETCATHPSSASCIIERMSYGFPVNSPTIRQLLGFDRKIDLRPIDDNDFERAKVLVDRFDAFVPLEYLQHPHVQQKLNETVPEYYQAWVKSGNMKSNNSTKMEDIEEEEELRALLFEQNKYDMLLYDYVLEKNGIKV